MVFGTEKKKLKNDQIIVRRKHLEYLIGVQKVYKYSKYIDK